MSVPSWRGADELHAEQVDEVFVKIHVGVQVSGELRQHAVVFDTGYLAGANYLAGDGRRAAVVVIRRCFGDHHGQVGLSRDGRGV